MSHVLKRLLPVLLVLMLLGCSPADDAAPPSLPEAGDSVAADVESGDDLPPWDDFVDDYIEASLAAHPAWAVTQGRHEYDGQLPDWSRAGIEAEIERLKAAREAAREYSDNVLDDRQQFQREYFIARIDHDLFWMDKARWPFRNPQYYFGWMSDSLDPAAYVTLDYAPLAERMAAFTDYLEAIPQAAAHIRENLEMPMPRTWLQLGVDSFGGYAAYFRDDVPAIFESVNDDALQQRFATALEAAADEMQGLADWLESNRDSATEDFALGPDLYRQMLWDTERVDTPLDELEAIGWADLERNQQALRDACAEFAPGEDVRACFQKMADRKPADGVVAAARAHLEETKQVLIDEDLVSIPGTEEALVDVSPPYARSNSAYINIPGPWEENQPSTYYISPPNPAWPEDVQAAYIPGEADLLGTSVHEVWPGHFLNFLHANRSPWIFGRAYVGYAFAEGWAHYTEEMMIDAGLREGDPEAKIGQLSNALLRNTRYLSSIGLHTKGWSVEDSKQFFMEEGFQSEGTALQQSARGTYDPAFLNYTMGKLMIMRLREDWTAERGGRDAWREFHDTFLSYGGPPVPLVRMAMMDEPEPRALFPRFLVERAEQRMGQNGAGQRQLGWVFDCEDGQRIVSHFKADTVMLMMPDDSLELRHVRSGSGARYESDGVEFWSKGDEATLTTPEGETTCVVNAADSIWEDARLRGADFRAVGNEPGWHLELFGAGSESLLVTDYGQQRVTFDAGEPQDLEGEDGSRWTAEAEGTPLVISLRPGPCADTMADIEYETRVTVAYGDRTLQGCGNALH